MSAKIRYAIEGNGPTVTLVHGVGASLESWDEVAEHMKVHFTLLRMNLRGHGSLTKPISQNCGLDDFVDDVLEAMNSAGFEKTHLVGFSMGGMIAQLLALTHPNKVNRLGLISAVADRTPEEKTRLAQRAKIIRNEGIISVIDASAERWFTPQFREKYPEKVSHQLDLLLANDSDSYTEAYRIFALTDVGERISKIPHKTLIVTGEGDIGSSPRMAHFMHEKIQNSELIILPDLRHNLLTEAPKLLANLIKNFLRADMTVST